jgi:hypothetical protein
MAIAAGEGDLIEKIHRLLALDWQVVVHHYPIMQPTNARMY